MSNMRVYIQYTHPSTSLTSVCFSSTCSQPPLPMFQIRIVLSSDPEAKRPSGSTVREPALYSKRCEKINNDCRISNANM